MKGVILDANSLGNADLTPIISTAPQWQVYANTAVSEIPSRIANADIVLTNKIKLSAKSLDQAKHLKLISVMATGTDNIDLDCARRNKIAVSNARAYATSSVVQHTISLMLCLASNVNNYIEDVRDGHWQKSQVFALLNRPIVELAGKKLGIIGYGELGSHVANVAVALGMKVLNSREVSLETTFLESDFISLHCPLTPETENLINSDTLKLMKRSAFLINTARGGLVNSHDLVAALEHKQIAGAAVDVLSQEPPIESEPLIQATHLDNLLVTPHNAWGAAESRQRLVLQTVENLNAYLSGKPIRLVI